MACPRYVLYIQFGFGLVLLITSIVMVVLWPSIYYGILSNQLILTKNSKSYEIWRDTPIPMYLDLYLYNLTNGEEVMANTSVKPHFQECGPYVFREYHLKVGEDWHDNGTIAFMQRRTWFFEPEMSNGSLDDNITNINVVATTIGYFVRHKSNIVRLGVEALLKIYSKPINTHTAGELLFDGYSDDLMDTLNLIPVEGFDIPKKFGWFYGRNETDNYDGVLSMYTGKTDINMLGAMDLWNYNKNVSYYDGECGTVNGVAGELFPPQTNPDTVKVFATDICSTVTLKRDKDDVEVAGIAGTLFTGDSSVFDSGWNWADEACYCPPTTVCQPWGTRNVSGCRQGAPAFVSFPHFYLADSSYTSNVDGLVPDKEKDEFRMNLQLDTGIPLEVRAQLQINILSQHIKHIPFFNALPDQVYFPTLWFRQRVTISEEYASLASFALRIPNIVNIVLYVLLALGAVLILIGLFIFIKYPMTRSQSTELLTER